MTFFRLIPKLLTPIFLFFSLSCFSQDLDSLIQVAEGMDKNIEQADLYSDISDEYNSRALYKDALKYCKVAVDIYREIGDKSQEAAELRSLGGININLHEYEEAEKILEKSKSIYNSLNDKNGIANVNSTLGELFAWKEESEEDYIKAKEYLFEAISYRLEHKMYSKLANNYFELAIIYDGQNNPAKTLEYYYKVIEICRDSRYVKNTKSNRLAAAYANSGSVYRDAKENTLAIEYYFKALESMPKNGNLSNRAIMNRELGLLHRRIDEFEDASNYLFKALNIGLSIENTWRIQEAYQQLGALHLDQNNLDSSKFYLDKSHSLSEELDWNYSANKFLMGDYYYEINEYDQAISYYNKSINRNKNYTESYKGLADCYKSKGDFQKSTELLEIYQIKKDSISDLLRIPAVSLSDTKQEKDLTLKETRRIEEQELKVIQERNYLQYSAAMLVIIILLLVLNLVVSFKLPPIAIKCIFIL